MFERYTEKARRSIFFGRYEASQFGSPYIESEHLLLGLLREDKALTHRFLRGGPTQMEEIRKQIESATMVREKVSTSVDLPLSNECRRVLAYAAEEAERLSHKHIGTEHLLLGLLREEKSFGAQILNERGIRLSAVREAIAVSAVAEAPSVARTRGPLDDFSVNMSQMALEERLLPMFGREQELDRVMHVLGLSGRNNVLLVGEAGVGKRTIVEGLAQRVVDSMAPDFLAGKMFVAVDLGMVVTAAQHSARAKEFLGAARSEMMRSARDTIFVFDELCALAAGEGPGGAPEITLLLKSALLDGGVRCIASATPQEYRAAIKGARWLERCFRVVEVKPASEGEALNTLRSVKERFEKFHSVQYTEEALQAAVISSNRHIKNRYLPDKAIDLIDDAGGYVKMKHEKAVVPAEVIEARKRSKFVVGRMEDAIANHEFEKARFYSDEEKKQRELLRDLEEKHNLRRGTVITVTAEHIEEALSRWTGIPVGSIRDAAASCGEEPPARPRKGKKKKSP